MAKHDVQYMKTYVESGGDYLSRDMHGETPFYRSCKEDKINHFRYLVDLPGVDLFGLTCNGTNAIYAAVFGGNLDIVKALVAKGYDSKRMNLQQKEGCTAFYCACQQSNLQIAQYLLDNGAQIDIPDEDGCTCLHSAVATGNIELFDFLLDRGANPLAVNKSGNSVFTFADVKRRRQMRKIMEAKIGQCVVKDRSFTMCDHCSASNPEGLMKCSSCLNAAYCSKACQKAAWNSHKKHCKQIAAAAAIASLAPLKVS